MARLDLVAGILGEGVGEGVGTEMHHLVRLTELAKAVRDRDVICTPARARATEAALLGQPWAEATVEAAITALCTEFKPLDDLRASAAYRHQAAAGLLHKQGSPIRLYRTDADFLRTLGNFPTELAPINADEKPTSTKR